METTTTTKVCKQCGEEKPLEAFRKYERNQDGYQARCRKCYYNRYKASINAGREKFLEKHGTTQAEYCRDWYQKNKEKHKKNVQKYILNRRKVDESFRIENNVRHQLSRVIRDDVKRSKRFENRFGYSVKDFRNKLEPQYDAIKAEGKYPTIDHCIPFSFFKKDCPFSVSCALENLQYVPAGRNLKKNNGYASYVGHEYLNIAMDYIEEKYLETFTFSK